MISFGLRNGAFIVKLLSGSQRKHTVRWIQSRKENYLFNKPSPWIAFDAIDYITPKLFAGMNVFEYGSGGSTLFWLSLGANVVSVEHDLTYAVFKDRENLDCRNILPVKSNHTWGDPTNPDDYRSSDPQYAGYSFYDYVSQIDEFPDNHFDLILIDGRSRPSCIKHSVSKVKPGGMIILDNSNREYYTIIAGKYLKGFTKREFYGALPVNPAFVKTTVYTKFRYNHLF